jgi:hypothetical protein
MRSSDKDKQKVFAEFIDFYKTNVLNLKNAYSLVVVQMVKVYS